MATTRAPGTSSPSASSVFLPLGRSRAGSLASFNTHTQAEQESASDSLDQAHLAACQSDTLTAFNEFTEPPASSVADNKGFVGDLQGGLSGLYSKFRASVGMRDATGRVPESLSSDSLAVKSPKTASFVSNTSLPAAVVSSEDPSAELGAVQASKLRSPTTDTFVQGAQGTLSTSKQSRMSSKAGSVSSKSSGSAVKTTLAPLTAIPSSITPDPTVTEVNVNAVKDVHHNRSHSGALSTNSPISERRDSSLATPASQEPSLSRAPRSPELVPKPARERHKYDNEAPELLHAVHSFPARDFSDYEGPTSPTKMGGGGDRSGLAELDTSFIHSGRKGQQTDGDRDRVFPRRESQQGDSIGSLPTDNSPVNTSVSNSVSKLSTGASSNQDNNRTPTTLATSLTMTDKEPSSAHSSKTSLRRQQEKQPPPRVNQPRLPGFELSRKSSAGTASTGAASHEHSRSNTQTSRQLPEALWERTAGQRGAGQAPKNKLLSRDFWMRDENAKDCFYCGEPFSTFRRKHHCRTCGQIFDAKCTSLVPGTAFGHSGSVRLCRPCEAVINAHDDDSSEASSDELSPIVINQRLSDHVLHNIGSRFPADDDDASSVMSQSVDQVLKTPTMAIPATRRTGDGNNRRSAILEIDSDRQLTRPTSSRSLRSSLNGRTHSISHKRHHSRQQYIRGLRAYHEDRAPFQRRAAEEIGSERRLPAFHRDNIIDPDLAQYLSDDASSSDEQPNLFGVVADSTLSKSGGDSERSGFGGLLAAVKKGRSRAGDKSFSGSLHPGRDGDDASITSSRAVNLPRSSRRRNLSVASSIHQRLSPRPSKDDPLLVHHLYDQPAPQFSLPVPTQSGGFKMTRSSSMRGAGAPPVELNRASLEHVRKLLRQLLKDASIPNFNSWEKALLPILLKATDDVDPDVQQGDDMDIRHYVKLKRIPGGHPGDTSYVSGLVFTKNVALKSMPRSISHPNILIITFPLEYARQQQQFMSLEPVIRQEREFLENLVNRIAALKPNLLLVQKSVSGLALQLLEAANIATVYNVKPSIVEAVSRCTQTKIITSIDRLATNPAHPGHCGSFDVKTYVHKGRKKTYIYISGCPKELGCTIVLRGADDDVLSKVKRVTDFMVYVVYNLKLETCLMRDEFAKIPSTAVNGTTNSSRTLTDSESVSTPDSNGQRKEVSQSGEQSSQSLSTSTSDKSSLPGDLPTPTFYEDIVQKHQTKLLSASPFVKFMPPYPLMRARELEQRLAYLKRLRDQGVSDDPSLSGDGKSESQRSVLITPEMIRESPSDAPGKVKEVLHAVHDAEYDRALHNYQTQKRQWETYISGNSNLFDPYAHQHIVVLYSLVCATTSVPCSGPDIFALGFYNERESDTMFEPDCTLGQYVEDLCLSANTVCEVNGCDERMFNHHRQYVHGEAQITVFIQPYPAKLRGLQDTILMWSCCKICGNETPPMPMSPSTWKYSFGKYLELAFCGRDLQARAGVCPHDLHRDHLRFFGYKDIVLRIHYDPISLLEVVVPRPRVTWKVDNDLKLRNEIYTNIEERINRFMTSVKARLKDINVDSVMPEIAEACKQEVDALLKKANEDHAALIKQHQEQYVNSKYWEIIPLNRLIRATLEKVVQWDSIFAEFERNYFPSEKDIRLLASLQLKKIFLDRDVSTTSLPTDEDSRTTPTDADGSTLTPPEAPELKRRMTLTAEEAQDVLTSVVEEHSREINKEKGHLDQSSAVPPLSDLKECPDASVASATDVQHLDLAISPDMADRLSPKAETAFENMSRYVSKSPGQLKDSDTSDGRQPEPEGRPSGEEGRPVPSDARASGIPRPVDLANRRGLRAKSPPLLRTYSQPAHLQSQVLRAERIPPRESERPPADAKPQDGGGPSEPKMKIDKRFSDRFPGLAGLKSGKLPSGHSLIPRSVTGKKGSRVSSLAKHFEQLSREFEKERKRERERRVGRGKNARAYPMAPSNPIVEVYKSVRDAVEERDQSDEVFLSNLPSASTSKESTRLADDLIKAAVEHKDKHPAEGEGDRRGPTEEVEVGPRTSEDSLRDSTQGASEAEEDDLDDDLQLEDSHEDGKISPEELPLDLRELPKHERSSLVKMLTSFWAERSASGWAPLDYPLGDGDHVFADSDIIVRDDEPSSLIAFALNSEDYRSKLAAFREQQESAAGAITSGDEKTRKHQAEVEQSLLSHTSTHLKYQFQESQAKMLCKVFYAEQFDALRRKCGVSERIVESLSRCMKWDSKGGKTKSLFLKTLDDRFILKSLSPVETQAFLRFAPAYFQIMSEALFHELPSAIAKMFGFYQVIVKNPATGVDYNWFLLVMENLFYDRNPTRIFDLKGSMRNRKVQSTGEQNEVLLDENMVEYIFESPLFTREHSKKLLSQSVWNDTLFLARQNVMDYSLMIAIDEPREEIVVGIIDCIRTYTWDKRLESWIKDRGFAGGGKNRPTVTSPKEYKSRFREAMARYVLHAPNPWYQFHPVAPERRLIKSKNYDHEQQSVDDEKPAASPDVKTEGS